MYKNNLILFIYFCVLLLLSNSCSLIGFGVGSIIDAKKSGEHYTINEELFEISPETEIQIITVTNDTLKGLYKNTTNKYSDDYIS